MFYFHCLLETLQMEAKEGNYVITLEENNKLKICCAVFFSVD